MSLPCISLDGRVAIVTGGRRVIGKAVALRFAEAEADVAICDYVAGSELDSATEEIKKTGQRSLAVQFDVRNVASINNLVKQVHGTLGDVDILANVAGTAAVGPLVELPEEEWDRALDTNLKGYYLMCQAAGKLMIERKRGCIINIASVDAFLPIPYQSA